MSVIGTFLSVAILWFLITLFTGTRDSSQSLRETWIVVCGVGIVGILSRFLLVHILGPFTALLQIAVLYFLVDWACGCSRKATIKICAYYTATCALISLGTFIFNLPTPGK